MYIKFKDWKFLHNTMLFLESVCSRLWSFERVPNQSLRGLENAIIFTSNKEACLSACLSEVRFVCRSVEFNYVTKECRLSEFDRRSPGVYVHMVESQGVDYFENACLQRKCLFLSYIFNVKNESWPLKCSETLYNFKHFNDYLFIQ